MGEYITVKKEARDFFIEKKSRFIGACKPVKTEAEALSFIASIKKEHWDASHNVYAYSLKEGGIARFSDDGEPQGKAGIPVLDVMQKAGVVDAVIVATRYFGGTLLGGGGLIRAYSHTASIALLAAGKIMMKECLLMSACCNYDLYGRLAAVIPECKGIIDDTLFGAEVEILFHMPPEGVENLHKKIADATNGRTEAKITGSKYFEMEIK